MAKQPRQEPGGGDLLSPRSMFESNLILTTIGAAAVRPFLLGGQGRRAYGLETLIAFAVMPLLGVAARSETILVYWEAWCVLVVIRMLLADRRQHTRYWGHSRVLKYLTFGCHRLFEPLAAGALAYHLWPDPLAKLIGFGTCCLLCQFRLGAAMRQRQREAIHDATLEAGHYR